MIKELGPVAEQRLNKLGYQALLAPKCYQEYCETEKFYIESY